MGLYNFEKRFVPFILAGTKKHTIRAVRAHPDKPGNTLHLYTGLRQKGAKLLMRVPCVKVEEIEIRGFTLHGDAGVMINGQELTVDEREALAERDGFRKVPIKGKNGKIIGYLTAWAEMLQFWNGRLPFKGHVIHWK